MTRALELRLVAGVAILAAAAPSLLAFNLPPSPTFLNQAVALALWGWFATTFARMPQAATLPQLLADTWRPLLALGLVAVAAMGSWGFGALPLSLALSGAGALAAAAVLLIGGAAARRHPQAASLMAAFCAAWVVAGLLNAVVAGIQVFAPHWADGDWIARSGIPGRAVGNLRQPNHLSSLLIWAVVALVPLVHCGRLKMRWALGLMAAFMLGVVLSASRTGLLSVLILAVWGGLDRRLSAPTRRLLWSAPLVYALAWGAAAWWASASGHVFGAEARLGESDLSASRFGIWANTLALIKAQPWLGVGFGEFNHAWSLSAFPQRPGAFFDHAHNLPLHLLAELGVPLGGAVCALLMWALWQAWQHTRQSDNTLHPWLATACMLVLLIGLHSQLEYPLWYCHFLLPTAWMWGFVLGRSHPAGQRSDGTGNVASEPVAPMTALNPPQGALVWGGVALVLCAGLAFTDYVRVAHIFVANSQDMPLDQRIARGQRSVLFSHHADYAAATLDPPGPGLDKAFAGATHFLLDTRLMVAWSRHLHATGRETQAQHVADRIREFRNPASRPFFETCAAASEPAPTYPCRTGAAPLNWRDVAFQP